MTAVGAGAVTITATSEGQSGSAAVTVTLAPVASVSVTPASQSMGVGETRQLTATLRDAAGNVLTGRVIAWSSNTSSVATVSASGLVTAQGVGTATITATSEGQSGTATVTVSQVTATEPVFNASNPNHVLHVFENWSTYSTPSQIGSTNRVDGGGPWQNDGASHQTFSTNNNDPWFGTKTLSIDFQDPPGTVVGSGVHQRGFVLDQGGSPPRYRNAGAVKDCLVIEWAVRQSGTAVYVGKIVDWQPSGYDNLGRFNFQNSYDRLGSQQASSCDADPLCSKYFANNGTQPRFAGLPPATNWFGDQFARSSNLLGSGPLGVEFYSQNRNFGTGAGQFRYDENQMLDNVWRRYIIRLTLDAPGTTHGHGRIEQWIQRAGGPAVKVMDFNGEIGAFDAGLVFVGPNTNSWLPDGAHLTWYHLTAVYDNFAGGNTTHLGYFRMWSHPRSELP